MPQKEDKCVTAEDGQASSWAAWSGVTGGPRVASVSWAQAGGRPSTPTLPRLKGRPRPEAAPPPHDSLLPRGGGEQEGDGSKMMGKGNRKK